MRKICAFFTACLIFILLLGCYEYNLNKKIKEQRTKLYALGSDYKTNCIEATKTCFNTSECDTVLVLGSSELSSFNQEIVNYGNSSFNMYLIGRGYTQCLQNTISLIAIENEVNIKKVVLIVSPQWFESSGILNSEIFSSRFQKGLLAGFIKNPKISKETKQKILSFVKPLEIQDENELEIIEEYEAAYINEYNLMDRFLLDLKQFNEQIKTKKDLLEILGNNYEEKQQEKVKFENYNFNELLNEVTDDAKALCMNNQFHIMDSYYDEYIKQNEQENKNARINEDFNNIAEYEYFDLFLEVCDELGIQPLIVNVPVNGKWYDWIGISREKRQKYYEKIKQTVEKHNAKIADFSDCEYEDYFLNDIMHLGWRGWIKVDEAIYKYYYE